MLSLASGESRAIIVFSLAQFVGESLNVYRLVRNFHEDDNNEMNYSKEHNRLLMSFCESMGFPQESFGNPNFCGDGPLTGLV